MPRPSEPIELNHRVDLYVPSQCICSELLPEALREAVIEEIRSSFDAWFGGYSEIQVMGGWRLPDGKIAKEHVLDIYAYCTESALKCHGEDVDRLARDVANQLTQDGVFRVIDNLQAVIWSHTVDGLRPGTNCACKGTRPVLSSIPGEPREVSRADRVHNMMVIQSILQAFASEEDARKLFCNRLNYAFASGDLPVVGWPEGVREKLVDQPRILAEQNGFRIVHLHLAGERLRRGAERAVIRQILQDDRLLRGLFVVSNSDRTQWEFLNPRLQGEKGSRLLLRSLRVGKGRQVRTATERMIQVEIGEHEEKSVSAAEIQDRHDRAFDVEAVTREFYREIAGWHFWALQHPRVVYPRDVRGEDQRSVFLIRLLTRLVFCWFLRAKGLIPEEVFHERHVGSLLKDLSPEKGTYYKAFLQNLFFATLNQEQKDRAFRKKHPGSRNGNRGVTNLYRYAGLLRDPDGFVNLLGKAPFVNGGLFDCLDRVYRAGEKRNNVRLDDFSEERANPLCIPNELFFAQECEADLSSAYGGEARHRKDKVRGLIRILERYNFVVEESTPLDQEVALDPEMLGKVFENLLASYNEETRTTARKATGSFYTPREVVSYMVDEALIAHLRKTLGPLQVKKRGGPQDGEERVRSLFSEDEEPLKTFSDKEKDALIRAIDGVRILDLACGSGAFPMGALQRLVDLLQKLDPCNRSWKTRQLERARHDLELAERMQVEENRRASVREVEERIAEIERSFDTRHHALDFARKLYLIENCIYGVDIQPIACQIAKLRFFIALIVDQIPDDTAPNRGVLALPNLETKIVAADSLMPVERRQEGLPDSRMPPLRQQLQQIRHEYFQARTPERKERCRRRDAELRQEIARLLEESGWTSDTAKTLASWDPYDQNDHARFFDPEWMFGIPVGKAHAAGSVASALSRTSGPDTESPGSPAQTMPTQAVETGFDIVISNPPYVRQEHIRGLKPGLKEIYDSYTGTADLYVYFYERSVRLLGPGGVLSYISSNKWFRSAYGRKLRAWLTEQTRILRIIDFGDAPVFTAIAYPCIVILERRDEAQAKGKNEFVAMNWIPGPPVEQFADVLQKEGFRISQADLKPDAWHLESKVRLRLLERLQKTGTPLGEYVHGKFYYGIKTGLNEAFVVDRATRDRLILEHRSSEELLKPFLRGKDVKRWRCQFAEQYLIKIESSENKDHPWSEKGEREAEKCFAERYPAIHSFFVPLRRRLIDRYDQGSFFWELRSCDYWREFEQPKVIVPAIQNEVSYAPDLASFYGNDKTSIFIPPSIPFALAITNSRVSWWITSRSFASRQGGFYEFKPMYVSMLPIPAATERQVRSCEQLAELLIWAHAMGKEQGEKYGLGPCMIGVIETLLNGLVYELFFPEELHARKIRLFDETERLGLPDLKKLSDRKKRAVLTELVEKVSAPDSRIASMLDDLSKIEEVRIVEESVQPRGTAGAEHGPGMTEDAP